MLRFMRSVSHIVIHCSATPNGQPCGVHSLDEMHKARGFLRRPEWASIFSPGLKHIGYHCVIDSTGMERYGRHLDEIGAHVQGSNARSVGVCMTGTDAFTQKQWGSLARLVGYLQRRYPDARVLGHRDFSPDLDGDGVIERHEWIKTCPGFDVAAWLAAGKTPDSKNVWRPK